MRFLIVMALCVASAFAGAFCFWASKNVIEQGTQDIRREMDDKVQLLGEQYNLLYGKFEKCLDAKYRCCK